MTGVRRGIGHAVVDQLTGEGMQVAGTIRPGSSLPTWASGAHPHLFQADATDAEQTAAAVEAAVDALGGLDVIVANAGRGSPGSVLDAGPDQWIEQCLVKLASVTVLVRAALPYLRRSSSPRIVVVGGVTAISPDDDQGVVSALRAAQVNVVVNLARRLAPDRICVNAVLLGAVLTDRQRDRFAASGADDFDAWEAQEVHRRGIPFGRFGTAEEAAAAIGFLASQPAGYITGTALVVSGGLGI